MDLFFQTLGRIASVVGIVWFFYSLWDRNTARVVIHYWWETTLDPVQRRKFPEASALACGYRTQFIATAWATTDT